MTLEINIFNSNSIQFDMKQYTRRKRTKNQLESMKESRSHQGKKRYRLTPSRKAMNEMSNHLQQSKLKTLRSYITHTLQQGGNEPSSSTQNQVMEILQLQ